LSVSHGAPLGLRIETQLGYKMVKYLKSIEFVSDYKNIGMGQGGHREDHMYRRRNLELKICTMVKAILPVNNVLN
jgi:DMSO/TMAO reductase YedYZ molybdopterin-dependent catalytic subunit